VGFRPEIFVRVGVAEFKRNEMINFVIAPTMRCDAVLLVNFPLHFRRNVPHLLGVSGYTEILHRDSECISRRQLRIGKYWGGLLREDEGVRNNKKAMVLMNIGKLLTAPWSIRERF
jgi:hypothetical protein